MTDRFKFFCLIHQIDLSEIETVISQLEEEEARVAPDLRDTFDRAKSAFMDSNLELAEALLGLIKERMFTIKMAETAAPFAKSGYLSSEGSKKGHERRYGTQEEKVARSVEYQSFIDNKHKEKPTLSYEACAKLAAKHFKISLTTIKTHTENWKTPSPKN